MLLGKGGFSEVHKVSSTRIVVDHISYSVTHDGVLFVFIDPTNLISIHDFHDRVSTCGNNGMSLARSISSTRIGKMRKRRIT